MMKSQLFQNGRYVKLFVPQCMSPYLCLVPFQPNITTLFQKDGTKNDTEGSSVKLEGRKGAGGQTKKPEGGKSREGEDRLTSFFQIGVQYATTEGTHSIAVTVVQKSTT